MKRVLSVVFLSCAALAVRGEITPARAAFERPAATVFGCTSLEAAEFAPDAMRYDKASGTRDWIFALPFAKDWRLRFVYATFDGGRFVKGELKVFGFDPEPLDDAAFEALRAACPMVAVRANFDDLEISERRISAFYRALNASGRRTIVMEDDADEAPRAYALGALEDALKRLGLSSDRLVYRVTVTSAKGLSADCGVGGALDGGTVFKAIRAAIEKAEPQRKGQVSERDIVDFRRGATATYVPVAYGTKR